MGKIVSNGPSAGVGGYFERCCPSDSGKAAARYVLDGESTGAVTEIRNGACVSYTVPQRVRPLCLDKTVDVFFRVNRIFGKSHISLTYEDKELMRFKREHMAPGEMEHLVLPASVFQACKGTLTITCEEDN